MTNYKNIGWVEELQDQSDEKSGKGLYHAGFGFLLLGCRSLTTLKEHTNRGSSPSRNIKNPVLKKEKS